MNALSPARFVRAYSSALLAVMVASLAGCAHATVARSYQNEYGCTAKPRVTTISSSRYRAEGCVGTAVYQCITEGNCFPTDPPMGSGPRRQAAAPAASPPPSTVP